MNAVETLTKARDLIARPGGWTQRAIARTSNGRVTVSSDNSAVCWCALGAYRACGGDDYEELNRLLGLTELCDEVEDWNDDRRRTQAEVVAAFDRAIALAEAEATP